MLDRRRAAAPLVRSRALRVLIAATLGLAGLVTVAGAFVLLVWLVAPERFLAAFLALLVTPFVALAIVRGRWQPGAAGALQGAAAGFVAVYYAVAVLAAAGSGRDALRAHDSFGVYSGDAGGWMAIAGVGLLALGALAATVPTAVNRSLMALVTALIVVAGLGAVSAGAVVVAGDDCGRFRLSPAGWREALREATGDRRDADGPAQRMADAIIECRPLDGATRADVDRLLGRPRAATRRAWRWSVGVENDLIGPGDDRELTVVFGPDGRVQTVR